MSHRAPSSAGGPERQRAKPRRRYPIYGVLLTALLSTCTPPDRPEEHGETPSSTTAAAETRGDNGPIDPWTLDQSTALALTAMPLSCIDRPHALRPDRADYLDDVTYQRRDAYEGDLAFYGCWDWHSAVNSTWTMVRILKDFPDLPIAPLVREKLRDHLSERSLLGELAYITDNPTFERPYGWAWLLRLHAELASWREPEAAVWAGRLGPIVRLLSTRTADHIAELDRPVRRGVHPNTAFAITTMLEATKVTGNLRLERILEASARRLYSQDRDCPTAYEPGSSDFLSPCLEEAALMAAVLEPGEYRTWLDAFLPRLDNPAFKPLLSPVPVPQGGPIPLEGNVILTNDSIRSALGSRSHLIGLAFTRAEAMLKISSALARGDAPRGEPDHDDPRQEDPRIDEFRRLASEHASAGFDAMFDADYAGSHWIGSFALKYLSVAATVNP